MPERREPRDDFVCIVGAISRRRPLVVRVSLCGRNEHRRNRREAEAILLHQRRVQQHAGFPGSGEASVLLNATLMQEDRFGLPAIATVFIPTAERDAYNQGTPATDRANYTDEVVARLTAFGHPNPAGLAAALLPDMQPINTSLPTAF